MILYDEIYFEITATGAKSDIKRFVKYLKGGALDDYFEMCSDYISYDDDFSAKEDGEYAEVVFANDELGIELHRLDSDDFLEIFCKETERLDVSGHLYDVNDDEYAFTSPKGRVDFSDARASRFNDELDALADDEDYDDNY